MQNQPSPIIPDNFKSRVSRLYFKKYDFKDSAGTPITYERLVLEVLIKGEIFNLEFKPSNKDKAILMLADNLDKPMSL